MMRRWGEKGTIAILTAIQHQIARFYLLLCISVPSINCTNSFYFCCDDGGGSGMMMKMRERVGALSVIAILPGNCSVLLFSAAVSHFNFKLVLHFHLCISVCFGSGLPFHSKAGRSYIYIGNAK